MSKILSMAAAFAMLATTAIAQTAETTPQRVVNGQTFGAWTVTCEAVAMNETACVLNQNLVRSTDNVFLAQMMAFWAGDGSKRYLVARVPLGVYLPSGFAMRAETNEDIIPFDWQACSQTLCEALLELDDEMLANLTAPDTTIVASYRPNMQAEPVIFRFAMTGAQDGLEAIKPPAADAKPEN